MTKRRLDFGGFMRMLVDPRGPADANEPPAPEPDLVTHHAPDPGAADGCGSGSCGCGGGDGGGHTLFDKQLDRRAALGTLFGGVAAAATATKANASVTTDARTAEIKQLEFQEYIKGNFRLMTEQEKEATIQRLERLAALRRGQNVQIHGTGARPGVLYGYAFNLSRCQGYRDCVKACVEENNQDRASNMQYIRIFEMENGELDLHDGKADYFHEVPAEGHFYLGTQCFQCENPPCVTVCPVGATWKEPDGITVIDYDWCIGCRYCEAACPYWARRFNWHEPEVPNDQLNTRQHYLGNRPRQKGVMEKCTFCIQRTRQGENPACVDACPTGARIFGNLLDPDSEIRWVIENKKVFRLKEDLGTEPKFWYFMD